MSHIAPNLRTAFHPTYAPTNIRRSPSPTASDGSPTAETDFRTILKSQPSETAAPPVPPAATTPATPPRTIGTVTPWSPSVVAPAPAAPTTSSLAPSAQSLFGDNPWQTDAGGTGPNGSYSYNHYYFATPDTAAKVAQMLGGKVVSVDAITPYGPFKQNQPNLMVQMPDGRQINAGLVAGFFDHGYSQQTVDQMIASEVSGVLG